MNGLKFPQLAPSTGPLYGKAIATGLSSAINNFTKMRMQQAQMQNMRLQAQGMNDYRQAQAEAMRQKSLGSSLQDVQLMQIAAKGGHADPSVLKPLIKDRYEQILNNATPEEKSALMQHMDSQINAGQVPSEVSSQMNLSPNALKTFNQIQGSQTKQEIGAGHDTAMNARTQMSQEGMTKRTGLMQQGQTARTQAITERNDPETRANLQNMKDLGKQMNGVQANIAALDKPPPMGVLPMDDATKETLKNKYASQLADLHGQYQKVHNNITGESDPTPQAPAKSVVKNALPASQWQQAQPGDYVQHPGGQYVQRLAGNHADGSPNFSSTPTALPQGYQAPQSNGAAATAPPPAAGSNTANPSAGGQ